MKPPFMQAERALPKNLQQEARTLFHHMRKRAGERNSIVHGTWAIMTGRPDSLILLDSFDLGKWTFSLVHRPTHDIHDFTEEVRMMEYKERDFRAIIDRIHAFESDVMTFGFRIGHHVSSSQIEIHER